MLINEKKRNQYKVFIDKFKRNLHDCVPTWEALAKYSNQSQNDEL